MTTISKSGSAGRSATIWVSILAAALAVTLWVASSARAAEVLFWDNYSENTVARANIDGSGPTLLNLTGAILHDPEGMAYDPVTNRLFVASTNGGSLEEGQIVYINLDGSGAGLFTAPGAPIESPEGVVTDPATRMIYWVNDEGTGSIAWAKLDGSAGGTLNTTGATLSGPYRIGYDPVAGRVYWDNSTPTPDIISYANVNNSGGGDLNVTGASTPKGLTGFAVDTTTGRIYWINNDGLTISFASTAGGSGGDVNLFGAPYDDPYGLAIDPSIGRVYWANYGHGTEPVGAFGFASEAGSGGGGINIAGPVNGPQDPVIIKSPVGTEAPKATRSKKSRSSLSCSTGGWASDFPGSFFYQSPRTFVYQWLRGGKPIGNATKATYNAKSAGKYACTVTATNEAGSASQTSAALNVKAAKVKLTAKKVTAEAGGVAKFKVKGVNQGDLQSRKVRVCAKLSKKAKGALKAPKCATLGKLKGHAKRTATMKVQVSDSAGGAYKLTFTVRGSAGKSATAKVVVK